MKLKIIILSLFLFTTFHIRSQNLSTIFIDTLTVVYNGDTVYTIKEPRILYVASDDRDSIVLFSDQNYRLTLLKTFSNRMRIPRNKINKKKYTFITVVSLDLYVNNKRVSFNNNTVGPYADKCGVILTTQVCYNNNDYKRQSGIKFYSRIINMAPADTSNYKFSTQEGLWIGKEENVKYYTVNFKENKKNGSAEVYYTNGSTYKTNYLNGKETSTPIINFKGRKSYVIPTLLTEECNDK